MDALIFDFDGVLIDSEPVHLACFRDVLESENIGLTSQQYYSEYLGYDDFDCFRLVLERNGRAAPKKEVRRLIGLKTRCVLKHYTQNVPLMPGAAEIVREAQLGVIPMAVCSGGLPQEIELAARTAEIRDYFMTVVSAEDVAHGKPNPEGYRLAFSRLCQLTGLILRADKSLAIEDSPAGIAAAKAAGLKVLAVTTSRPAPELADADKIVKSLADVDVADLEQIVNPEK